MRLIATAAALMAGACLMLAGTAMADPFEDAMARLPNDPVGALADLEIMVAQGDVEAMNVVAIILNTPADGAGVPHDPDRAVELWERSVAGGSQAARLNYGTQLLLNDAPTDDARAVALLREVTIDDLVPLAAFGLGRAHLFGAGVEQDLAEGSRLMKIAVEAAPQNMDAQFLMGRAYQNGWGIPVDPAAAYRHLRIAADAGDYRAQWHVGMALLQGEGVAANPVLARAYVRQSAQAGYLDGMISMAVMLALGEGGPVDAPQAREWYRRAAETGSAHALRGLGMMLITGEGGPADTVTGVAYLDLAAKAGDPQAVQLQGMFRDQIAATDPAEVETAKSLWLREHGMPR